jgi:hypothetical protein
LRRSTEGADEIVDELKRDTQVDADPSEVAVLFAPPPAISAPQRNGAEKE